MRKILEDLIFSGYIENTVEIYDKTWRLRTLTSEENLAAINAMSNYTESLSRIYALKIEVLGRSLKEVNGILIENVEEGIEFIKNLQTPIVNRLYEEYEKLYENQQKSLVATDELKN